MTDAVPAPYRPVSVNRDYLAGNMLEAYARKHPKTWAGFSIERRVRVREEFLSALRILEESLATGSPAFLVDHGCRARSRFAAGHFPPEFAVSFATVFREIVTGELQDDLRKEAGEFAGAALSAIKTLPGGKGACRDAEETLSPVARSFLKDTLAGRHSRARETIDKEIAAGMTIPQIWTEIFAPVLRETGRLWQQEELTIAEEHYVSAAILRLMDRQQDQIGRPGRKKKKKTVVTACVGEELHGIGIRMVAGFFEMAGWNVYHIGANTPAASILEAVRDHKADAVALSITMPWRLTELRYLIRSLRADGETTHARIIVGGYPFTLVPGLWKQVGADAGAADAGESVREADRLTSGRVAA